MARSFSAHVRSDKIKWVLVALAFLVLAVVLCAIFTKGFTDWNPFCWFGHDYVNGDCTKCHAVQTASVAVNSVLGR